MGKLNYGKKLRKARQFLNGMLSVSDLNELHCDQRINPTASYDVRALKSSSVM